MPPETTISASRRRGEDTSKRIGGKVTNDTRCHKRGGRQSRESISDSSGEAGDEVQTVRQDAMICSSFEERSGSKDFGSGIVGIAPKDKASIRNEKSYSEGKHGRKTVVTCTATTSSGDDRDSSGAGSGNGSGNSGGNVVTVGTTNTTSSGDDRDSSGMNGSSGNGSGHSAIAFDAGPSSASSSDPQAQQRHYHHHHHRSHHRRRLPNDGSSLRVPGNDGSDRLTAASSGQGGSVSTTPATVVAARLPPPNADCTTSTNATTSSSGSGGEGEATNTYCKTGSLLQPHHKPDYHTIRRTFSKLPSRRGDAKKHSTTDSSVEDEGTPTKKKSKHHGLISSKSITSTEKSAKKKKSSLPRGPVDDDGPQIKVGRKKAPPLAGTPRGRGSPSPESDDSNQAEASGGGSSSGSGTEGGYAGSASSNEINGQQASCSSPSVSSSEDSVPAKKSKRHRSMHHPDDTAERRGGKPTKTQQSFSSSEIADFSSEGSTENGNGGGSTINTFSSASPSLSSLNGEGSSSDDLLEMQAMVDQACMLEASTRIRNPKPWAPATRHRIPVQSTSNAGGRLKDDRRFSSSRRSGDKPPILTIGSDIMAHVLTFLEPPNILDVLTMPLSKDWRRNFTCQPELWRVLCLVEPFKARIEDDGDSSSSGDSFTSLHEENDHTAKKLLGRYRLLYSSFVRCMRYLAQIKDDAINGRAPSFIDYGLAGGGAPPAAVGNGQGTASTSQSATSPVGLAASSSRVPDAVIGANKSLKSFFARARGVIKRQRDDLDAEDPKRPRRKRRKTGKRQPTFGTSMLTSRILGPSESGQPGSLSLPWSCAIYSIVNWMVAFSDVEGIQTLCLKVLPYLLEDEQQRITAQRASLTDVVLRAMVMFSNSVQLHTAAFHTIVLLARPLGGREGMLFHSSMVNASGIFGADNSQDGKNGITVMLDSMQRFETNDVLQAMSCWSLVNIALAPAQKGVLVKLGGIQATANAMLRHPYSAEVQFRALFALINLVIPSVRLNPPNQEDDAIQQEITAVSDESEKEVLDNMVEDIINLVVKAMKNFCSSEAILNRACLVLHNLSLTQEYHTSLLWTPNCYQMIEWCLANYTTDQVLQQSASGTLHRLQMTLSSDEELRNRFTESIQSQQRESLEQAHREALHLHEEHERLQRERESEDQLPMQEDDGVQNEQPTN